MKTDFRTTDSKVFTDEDQFLWEYEEYLENDDYLVRMITDNGNEPIKYFMATSYNHIVLVSFIKNIG
jgi:hypothetical protein